MKGKHKITVQNKKIKYEFCLRRNITVIQGNSATGKTALVDMIREYYENGEESGIQLSCDKTCGVLEGTGKTSFHSCMTVLFSLMRGTALLHRKSLLQKYRKQIIIM